MKRKYFHMRFIGWFRKGDRDHDAEVSKIQQSIISHEMEIGKLRE
jgi:hypothetical protein